MNAKEILMGIKTTVSSFLSKEEIFVDVKGEDNVLYRLPEGGLVDEAVIQIINEDGTLAPVENGTYMIDGNEVIVKDSKVKEIKPVEAPVEETPAEEAPAEEAPAEEAPVAPSEGPSMEEVVAIVKQLIDVVTGLDARISAIENVEDYNKKFAAIEERINNIEVQPISKQSFKEEKEVDPYIVRLRNLKK